MLRKKALRKIFLTTLAAFVLISVYKIPNKNEELLPTNLEIEYLTGFGTNNIYLLTANNHLVKSKILLNEESVEKNALKIIAALNEETKELLPNGLKGIIPKNTKVLSIGYSNSLLTVDFSKEIYNVSADLSKKMIEAIVFSLTDIEEIEKVKILVEGKIINTYPNTRYSLKEELSKDIGINKQMRVNNRNNIQKIVIYYIEKIDNTEYYVPVTKYVNNDNEKIKVIIDELTTAYIYEPNLMSFLNSNAKLKAYEETADSIILNFNDGIFDNNDHKILEEVLYTISYSVFANYNTSKVVFKVNNKKVKELRSKDLP